MSWPAKVFITEVSPRDGLQNETRCLSVCQRVNLIQRLQQTGLAAIECGSFVAAKRLPQLADSDKVIAHLPLHSRCHYSALIPNAKGWQLAKSCAALQGIAVFTSASEPFCQHNIGCSIAQSLQRFVPIIEQARASGLRIRAYISCVWGCPFQGAVPYPQSVNLAHRLVAMGCDEIALADTLGLASPDEIAAVLYVMSDIGYEKLALHLHNRSGLAISNIRRALEMGMTRFDSAVAGLGGCPAVKDWQDEKAGVGEVNTDQVFSDGAKRDYSGNLASEDLVYLLQELGIETGVNLPALIATGNWLCKILQRPNASKISAPL